VITAGELPVIKPIAGRFQRPFHPALALIFLSQISPLPGYVQKRGLNLCLEEVIGKFICRLFGTQAEGLQFSLFEPEVPWPWANAVAGRLWCGQLRAQRSSIYL
jgi:hypothetical protein